MTTPAPWTTADDAELAVLVHAFVDGVWEHRERCSVCSDGWGEPGWRWCDHVGAALEEILRWRDMRRLLTQAAVLRALQDRADEEAARAA
jgi:hypothetical protein